MSINIFCIYAVIVFLAVGTGFLLEKIDCRKINQYASRIVFYLILLFFLAYSALSCWRFYHLIYGMTDFGFFDDMLRNLAFFKGFFRNSTGGFIEHFNILLIVFAPLYWIWDSPYMLLSAQAGVMTAAACPLFLLGKKKFKHNMPALLLVCLYLFNPYFSRYILYEFHAGCLFPLLFFSAFLALEYERRKTFLFLLFLAPAAKESFVIVLIACGLFLLTFRKYRREGVICLFFAVFWTVFITKIWFPHIVPLKYHHADRYPPVFVGDILLTLKNCWNIFLRALTVNGLAVFGSFLLAFSFLPPLSPRALIFLCGPVLLSQLCSINGHQQLVMSHYSDGCNIVFPLAAAYGLADFRRIKFKSLYWRRVCRSCLFTFPLFTHIFLCDLAMVKYHNYINGFKLDRQLGILSIPFNVKYLDYKHPALFHEIRNIIPPRCSIVAQNNLGCFFIRTNPVYSLPGPDNMDFYIFDADSYDGFDNLKLLKARLDGLERNPLYVCIVAKNGYFVFCRKAILKRK
ncbi:MAG: DUF2079 domain-containing protein [Victivallaceae bacterium]|nr:DUF2079 domain-containing protein [Victivallaceae bacterium]